MSEINFLGLGTSLVGGIESQEISCNFPPFQISALRYMGVDRQIDPAAFGCRITTSA